MVNETTATPPANTTAVTPGRNSSGGRGRGRGRGNRGENRNSSNAAALSTSHKSSFKGNTTDMNGHVFQVHSERPDPQQFDKTVEALGEYAAKNIKHFGDLIPFFKNLERPKLTPIGDPTAAEEASKSLKRDWENRCDRNFKRDTAIDDNLKALYSIAWGQCSEAMKAKLQSHDDFTSMDLQADSVWLLKEIRAITFQFEAQRYIFLALDDAHSDFRAYLQQPDETLTKYLHIFK
jgi:hypothetical protein